MIRAVAKLGATSLIVGGLSVSMAGPVSAQTVCPPFADGLTITLVGEDYEVPGHGLGCLRVPKPDVYVDENGTVVIDRDTGSGTSWICLVGIEGTCLVKTERL